MSSAGNYATGAKGEKKKITGPSAGKKQPVPSAGNIMQQVLRAKRSKGSKREQTCNMGGKICRMQGWKTLAETKSRPYYDSFLYKGSKVHERKGESRAKK